MSTTPDVEASPGRRTPPPKVVRWMVLIFISLAMFGNYYVYDSISPLARTLRDQLSFSDSQIGWLNGIYSLVNVIMVLIGGLIIDRIGTRKSTFLFAALCLIGAVITAVSPAFWVMLTGRLVFGLGAESLIVAVTTALAKWFRGKELSFAFGINLTIARFGSFLALNSLTWAKPLYENWQWPLLLSIGAGVVCVAGPVVYWILESSAGRKYDLGEEETEKVNFRDVFKFSKSYWYVVALCTTFYSAMFPFQTFAIKFFEDAHGTSPELSGFLSSILTLFAMIFTPLFGLMVDRVGKRSLFMFLGSLLIIPVYLMVAYLNISLFIPMAMMGISFSLIPAVMWPSVAYIVEEKRLGTAYGLMTMIQNIGMFGFNVIIGWANDISAAGPNNPDGYALGMWIFSITGLLGLVFSFLLWKAETGPKAHGLETIRTADPSKTRKSYVPLIIVFLGAIVMVSSTTFTLIDNKDEPECEVGFYEFSPLLRHEIIWPDADFDASTHSEINKTIYLKRALQSKLGPDFDKENMEDLDEKIVRQWNSYEARTMVSYGMIIMTLSFLILIIHFLDAFTESKAVKKYLFPFSYLLLVLVMAVSSALALDVHAASTSEGLGDTFVSKLGFPRIGIGIHILAAGLLITLLGCVWSPFSRKTGSEDAVQ